MRLKSRRGSNQYQMKCDIVDAKWCEKCGKPNFDKFEFNPFPIKIRAKVCEYCGANL